MEKAAGRKTVLASGPAPLGDEPLSGAGDLPSWPDDLDANGLDADELNIDDLDLDADLDLGEDEEITIFQFDEEITQLQLDAPDAAPDLADADGRPPGREISPPSRMTTPPLFSANRSLGRWIWAIGRTRLPHP
jgi:hypothetical protein